jgi:hypothetical protein
MVSTFTANKNLELPGNGDYVDTWNIPANGDFSIIDAALGGKTNLNATAGDATLSSAQYQNLILYVSGSIAADVTYTIPSGVGGMWIVNNATSGGHNVIIASGGGGTVATVPPSNTYLVAADGTNAFVANALTNIPTGGGTNKAFYLNDTVITDNYTVPNNQNAGTFGPVTVDSGVTVTVGSGSYWSIV